MMASSPFLLGLRHRLGQRLDNCNDGYRAFTAAFDEIIGPDDLSMMHTDLSAAGKLALECSMTEFDRSFSKERILLAEEGAKLIRDIEVTIADEDRTSAVVSFLIDHSGSMKGLRMISALLAVEVAGDVLRNAQIATEILGFTTTSWHGGESRKAWKWAGRPRNPGRLCDLRHIVYGAADRSANFPWHLRMALHPDFLRENIDGEALQWAAGRLRGHEWGRRVIIQLSDGAPIDDSTLLANDDNDLPRRHLSETHEALASEGFVLGTLLLGGENVPEPKLFERANEPLEAGKCLMRLLRRALIG